ncbi:benzoate/H(+) symporter BenE family transporter [Nocardioides sp. TF02-7]|uniref:benzoate/H(+) symporter BenE family transporter n=1 Tax=Nocardioides sp. TF02-7 TaxID=2917724 RepID=UPI001F069B80|nr:benzoate/H(+) symporter BenE family transporter [Nocardioides sp. TF02-7]UMG92770.1 benzoate/H(+) symporter BenE family transporter [Nocardioides sp. TF02-7]
MEHDRTAPAGITLALVGFASSFAVVLAGLRGVGASAEQAASGLLVLCALQAVGMLYLAHRYRIPVTLAWSTPGAALLAGTGAAPGGWPAAVGAFLVVGVLVLLTALWPPLGRIVAAIPRPVAQGMLAGILFSLCLAPFRALVADPVVIAPLVALWLVLVRRLPAWASPLVLGAALVLIVVEAPWPTIDGSDLLPTVELVRPVLDAQAVLGLALPLYLVTMASQNVPGAAVLSSFGYRVPWRASLTVTGAGTVAGSLAGGHAVNLAAITAAMAASPDVHADPDRRWRASVVAAWTYLALAVASSGLVILASHARPGLLETVAGLALLATLGSSLASATEDPAARVPAVVTFVVAASGTAVLGIGSAFWALLAGVGCWVLLVPRGGGHPAGAPVARAGSGTTPVMTTPNDEPLERADEADLIEQRQDLDGAGSVTAPEVTPDEADEADAVEQGAEVTTDDDAYPHQAEADEE